MPRRIIYQKRSDMTFREILARALEEKWATGHFNFSESDQARAICEAAKEVGSVAILGTSEGEAKHLGYLEAVALRDAFRKELVRIGADNIEKILASLEKRRVLETAPHLGATENPRMLCINWLGSLGVPNDEYYVVGMYSGIPFSSMSFLASSMQIFMRVR